MMLFHLFYARLTYLKFIVLESKLSTPSSSYPVASPNPVLRDPAQPAAVVWWGWRTSTCRGACPWWSPHWKNWCCLLRYFWPCWSDLLHFCWLKWLRFSVSSWVLHFCWFCFWGAGSIFLLSMLLFWCWALWCTRSSALTCHWISISTRTDDSNDWLRPWLCWI